MEKPSSTSRPSTRFTGINGTQPLGASEQKQTSPTDKRNIDISTPDLESDAVNVNDDDSDFISESTSPTPSSYSQQTIEGKASMQNRTKDSEGIKPPSKFIIDPSCLTKNVPSLQKARDELEKVEMAFPDDLPYVITYRRNVLEVLCQECNRRINVENSSIVNISKHSTSYGHRICAEKRLKKLEEEGFQRTFSNIEKATARKAMARTSTANDSSKMFLRLPSDFDMQLPRDTPNQKPSARKRVVNSEGNSDSEYEPLQLKRQRGADSSSVQPTINRVTEVEQEIEKIIETSEDVDSSTAAAESPLITRHLEIFEERMTKNWSDSQSAHRRITDLETKVDGAQKKKSDFQPEIDRIVRVEEEIKIFKEKISHFQTVLDRLDNLEKEVKGFAAQLSNFASLTERPEIQAHRSGTSSDFRINDLAQSNRMLLMRLAALEERNERLVSKIVELERK
ncbi:hypothetical protein NHQ30_006302 [Ciborinia camelliae]|nr:hypothetical protein NHQ30_006302 [Ciborinia camelliae]